MPTTIVDSEDRGAKGNLPDPYPGKPTAASDNLELVDAALLNQAIQCAIFAAELYE